jgi:peptide/nickel transport system substrate-binding protein
MPDTPPFIPAAASIRRRAVLSGLGAAAAGLPRAGRAAPEKVLRVAMTAADIPLTTGQASQGAEGQRFIGMQVYDGLINYDLSRGDVAAPLRPALATEWSVDAATQTIWTFKLRPGVTFHDGSAFTADAIVWNLDKLTNKDSKQFDPAQAAQGATYAAPIKSYRKIDDLTVELTARQPDAVFPYQIALIAISSPAQWAALGGSWEKFALKPSGTGPWKLELLVPRNRAELVRNEKYWDQKRIPKSDRQVLLPVPDPNTRVAALLSGQVDWIEAPPPDTIPRLKSSGMQIVTNVYPHVWPYFLSFAEGSPMRDIRVRKALNLGIDRDALVELLGGLALPAKGMVDPKHKWFGKPSFEIKYDPDQARKLLAEAGYSKAKPLAIKAIVSPSGSGQMQPQPMNDLIQQQYSEVGVTLEFDVMDWESLRGRRRTGVQAPENKGDHMLNSSWGYWDPDIGLISPAWSKMTPPAGFNWGGYSDPEADALCQQAKLAFVPAEQDKILQKLHERIVDQAMWIWVVHDLNPRALGPKVKGFVQAQSWWQDLTPVEVG